MSSFDANASASHADLYKAILEQAAQAGESIMEKVLTTVRQSLKERASKTRGLAERDQLELSLTLLHDKAKFLCGQYPQALRLEFSQKIAPAVRGERTAKPLDSRLGLLASVNFDQLELMDANQVHASVALARSQQSVMLAADSALVELNTYICATLDMKAVQPECNPLRTDVYVRALQGLIAQTKVPILVQMDWLQQMSCALGTELGFLYGTLSRQLQGHGVKAAGYAVVRSFAGNGRASGRDTAPVFRAVASAPAVAPHSVDDFEPQRDDTVLTLDRLRRLLAGELDRPARSAGVESFAAQFAREFESGDDAPHSTDFQSTIPAAFETLQEMKQVDRVMERIGQRRHTEVPANSARANGKGAAMMLSRSSGDLGQALSLEVVALMVENIAGDARLLNPIKSLVKSLEPSLLQLALVDRRFFSDKQHPARRLLQEITHRSLAYETVDTPGFIDFLQPLQQALSALADIDIESAEPFDLVLGELFQVWDEQDHPAQLRKAVQALQYAEERNLRADKIAIDIQARPETGRVPAQVLAFLTGPWAQVIAHAQLKAAASVSDPGQYLALVEGLLWSAQPELTRTKITKLTQLLPGLLAKLREGLNLIDYPSIKTSAFFELLMKLHQQAYKPDVKTENSHPAALHSRSQADADTWVAPAEARVSGFMELPEELAPRSSGPPSQLQHAAADADLLDNLVFKPAEVVATQVFLPLGSWVEMQVNGVWVRSQLSWASPQGSLFLFTSAYGSTQSMSRRSRDKLIANGTMRVIAAQALVDGALDAVAQSAMFNSMEAGD